jgi:hypothetical protein
MHKGLHIEYLNMGPWVGDLGAEGLGCGNRKHLISRRKKLE